MAHARRLFRVLTAAPALVLALALAIGASACAPSAQPQESWTVCLYLCGSDLETKHARATHTLAELMEADVPANVTVVVQTGGARTWRADGVDAGGMQRFVLRDHGLHELDTPPAASMGDAGTLAEFLEFCAGEYPSDRSMAVLWDHGGGPRRGICFDETSGYDALTLSELQEAFSRAREARGGRPYDIIGMDACLMASLETAVALQDDAEYLVASEEIEPGAGWDYDQLLKALGSYGAGEDCVVAACAICDGYLAKCADTGKDAAATLSVIDLSKTAAVEAALDDALDSQMAGSASMQHALSKLVWAASEALSFGGETAREGLSNLYDLGELASCLASQGTASSDPFSALANAVDDAVAYSVTGTATTGATGLSLYYPANFSEQDFRDYCTTTPLSAYAGRLTALYSLEVRAIEFSDAGSIDDSGSFSVTVSPDTLGGVYDIYVVNRSVDDDSHYETNIDIDDDWESGTFAHGLDDCTFTLNGAAIDTEMIDYDADYTVYSSPISLNGQETNLRIAEVATGAEGDEEDDADEWDFKVLGAWNGIDHLTGLSDRSLDSLEPDDIVGCISTTSGLVRDEVTIGGEATVELTPLSPGTYECWFVVIDLYGNETASDVLTYRVSEPSAAERAGGIYALCEPNSIASRT